MSKSNPVESINPVDLFSRATAGDKIAITQLFMAAAPNIDAPSTGGRTALEIASLRGEFSAQYPLLLAGANPALVSNKATLESALLQAAYEDKADLVSRLLDVGVSVNTVSKKTDQASLIHFAVCKQRVDDKILDVILSCGQEVNLEAKDQDGNTALHHAVFHGKFETVDKLLKAGAKLGVVNDLNQSPRQMAERNKSSEEGGRQRSESAQIIIDLMDGKPLPMQVQGRALDATPKTNLQPAPQAAERVFTPQHRMSLV